jgi:HD superfamily phosphodiesterase
MIKKGVVRFNMHSGSFRSQDKRMKGIILDYLRQQDLPVRLMKLKTMKDAR